MAGVAISVIVFLLLITFNTAEGGSGRGRQMMLPHTWEDLGRRVGLARLTGVTLTAWKDKVWLFGGTIYTEPNDNDERCQVSNELYEYGVATSKMTNLSSAGGSSLKRAGAGLTYCEQENKLFVFGGARPSRYSSNLLNDLHEYDVAMRSWTELVSPNAPANRSWMGFTCLDGKLYVCGGYGGDDSPLELLPNDLYQYDLVRRRWANITRSRSDPLPKGSPTLTVCQGRLFAFYYQFRRTFLFEVNVSTAEWTELAEPNAPHSAEELQITCWEGNLLVFGDEDTLAYNQVPVGVSLYDLTRNSWTRLLSRGGSPPSRLAYQSAWIGTGDRGIAAWNGKMFVVQCNSCFRRSLNVHQFDLATRMWTNPQHISSKSIPSKRSHVGLASSGSKVLVWGGHSYACGTMTQDVHEFDLASRTWTVLSSLGPSFDETRGTTPPGLGPGYAADGLNLYVFGGISESGGNDLSQFDAASLKWTNLSLETAPCPRFGMGVAAWDGRLFVFSGIARMTWVSPLKAECMQDLHAFDVAAGTWSDLSSSAVPSPRAGMGFTAWSGKLFVFGGVQCSPSNFRLDDVLNDLHQFELSSLTWSLLSSNILPSARASMGFAAWGAKLYVFGGTQEWLVRECRDCDNKELWQYDLAKGQWEDITPPEFLSASLPVPPGPVEQSEMGFAASEGALFLLGGLSETEENREIENSFFRYQVGQPHFSSPGASNQLISSPSPSTWLAVIIGSLQLLLLLAVFIYKLISPLH